MASRTQLRLGQVTGSFGDAEGKIVDNLAVAATLGAIPAGSGSMVSVMSQFASSIKRIVGGANANAFTAVAASTLKDAGNTDRISYVDSAGTILRGPNGDTEFTVSDTGVKVEALLDVDGTVDFDVSSYANTIGGAGEITVSDGNAFTLGNAAKDSFFKISADSDNTAEKLEIKAANSTNDGSITLESTAGGVFVNIDSASKRFHVDSEGAADLEATKGISLSNAAAADEDDITISLTDGAGGARDASIIITSAGTGTDAIDINATAGDMLIGKALADGKTLKIGKSGAVEMTIAPHGTAANEKFTLTNTAGTATDSVSLTAAAGGIKIDAGLDNASSLLLTGSGVKIDGSVARGIKIGTAVSGVPITIGHGTSEVTVADNLTVTGDLTVNGVTTQVDTTNLQVKDKNILLNDGGAALSAAGAGIDFEEDSSVTGYIRVADDDRANLDLKAPGGSELKLDVNANATITVAGALNIEGDSAINQDVTTDAAVQFASITANGGIAIDNITIDGTEIDLASGDLLIDVAGDIVLDADGGDIFFKDDGTDFLQIKDMAGDGGLRNTVLSSSLGDMIFVSNQTSFAFVKGAINFASPGTESAFEINPGTRKAELKVGTLASLRTRLELDDTNDNPDYASQGCVSDLSGSLLLDNGHVAGEIRFQEAGAGNNFMGFKAPDSVTANKVFTLPDGHPGSNNSAIVSSTAGVLSYASIPGATTKGIKVISSAVSAGTDVNFNSVDAGDTISGMDNSADDNSVDVFVNGQLLVSGSESERSAGSRDFRIKSATVLTFAFDLEVDDVVQLVKRG